MFAADLFAAGVPAVLVLPPLDFAPAIEVLHRLAGDLSEQPAELVESVRSLRGALLELLEKLDFGPELVEAAYDVCLFQSEESQGRSMV